MCGCVPGCVCVKLVCVCDDRMVCLGLFSVLYFVVHVLVSSQFLLLCSLNAFDQPPPLFCP